MGEGNKFEVEMVMKILSVYSFLVFLLFQLVCIHYHSALFSKYHMGTKPGVKLSV